MFYIVDGGQVSHFLPCITVWLFLVLLWFITINLLLLSVRLVALSKLFLIVAVILNILLITLTGYLVNRIYFEIILSTWYGLYFMILVNICGIN